VPAAQSVRAVLDQQHADRRQLGDLVASEPAAWAPLILTDLVAAAPARRRVVRDDLIDLILGREPTACTAVTLLRSRLARGAIAGQQLLGLRARLRAPLLTRPGRILRRRHRTHPRIPSRLLLQTTNSLSQQLHRLGQLQHELDAPLPPGVVDRLGLAALHALGGRPDNCVGG
jgi:hypothetical protein